MKIIQIPTFSDKRGNLTVLENQIPFAIARMFWITNSDLMRGGHRHIVTQQALCCLSGQSTIKIHDGHTELAHTLKSPNQILLIEPHEWHTMQNQDRATVLLVLASHRYKKEDYIYEPYD